MRRYTVLISVLLFAIMAFAGCNEHSLAMAPVSEPELEPAHIYEEAYAYHDATQASQILTISWQEAYLHKLLYYTQLPTYRPDEAEAEWRFMLHDINQNGIPELFLVLSSNNFIDYRAIYSFVDGDIVRPKTNITMEIANGSGGLLIPADSAPGIIRVRPVGAVPIIVCICLMEARFLP